MDSGMILFIAVLILNLVGPVLLGVWLCKKLEEEHFILFPIGCTIGYIIILCIVGGITKGEALPYVLLVVAAINLIAVIAIIIVKITEIIVKITEPIRDAKKVKIYQKQKFEDEREKRLQEANNKWYEMQNWLSE